MLQFFRFQFLVACAAIVAATATPASMFAAGRAYETVMIDGHEAVADEIIVKEKASVAGAPRRAALESKGMEVVGEFRNLPGIRRLKWKGTGAFAAENKVESLEATIAALKKSGLYEYVEPNWIVHAVRTPNDGAFTDGTLWGLRNTGQRGGTVGADINVTRAWDLTVGSREVVVGVIDTGIRYTHRDLAANMWRNPGEVANNGVDDDNNGYVDDVFGINAINGSGDPFDDDDHGTHVAGTIGAANDANPHVGVAWNVQLMALKFLDANGSGTTAGAIECLNYAIEHGAHLTNNSWGGGGRSRALEEAIQRAHEAGQLFVAAAGNDGSDIDRSPAFPAAYDVPNVVSVAALDRNDRLASFSNFGARNVDLGAPGVDIHSSVSSGDNAYDSFNGTSMASPHVAGVAALIYSHFPGIDVRIVKSRLMGSATPISALSGRSVTGGRVNAYGALTISADGVLEVLASSGAPLVPGDTVDFFVTVSDLEPITGASVSAGLGVAANTRFFDNGAGADQIAGDGVYSGRLVVPEAPDEVALNVAVTATGKTPFQGSFDFPVITPPPNDDFADRIVLGPGSATTEGDNRSATSEAGEPNQPNVAGGKSVWWTWTAPSTGAFEITTSGSDFDTTLAIFTGNSLGALNLIGANDDGPGLGLRSRVSFNAAAGQEFHVRVDGYGGFEGDIVLNYPPVGGAQDGPPALNQQPQSVSILEGETAMFSVNASGPGPITYQWFFGEQRIAGATLPELTIAAAEQADSGQYRVEASNAFGTTRSEPATLVVSAVGVRPSNDQFADAALLPGATGTLEGVPNRQATGESGEPDHVGVSAPLNSLWWKWQAPSNGVLRVDTAGSNFDTTLAAYSGRQVDALVELASNDDSTELQSLIEFEVAAGQAYLIAVDGYDSSVGEIKLTYAFTSSGGAPSSNDQFADRILVPPGVGVVQGSNLNGSGEDGEPNHAGASQPLASSWWSWRADEDGSLTVTASGTEFAHTLAVYEGSSVGALQDLGSGASAEVDPAASVTIEAAAGSTYAIAVDGMGPAQGDIVLNFAFEPARRQRPGNDDFDQADVLAGVADFATGSNAGATAQSGEPDHAGASEPVSSVWWRWEAPGDGSVAIDTFGSDHDTTLAVYTGDSVDSLQQIRANDDAPGNRQSQVFFDAEAGTAYHIAVDGAGSSEGAIALNLTFLEEAVRPDNDDFEHRIMLSGLESSEAGSNLHATGETGESDHGGVSLPLASIWYEYTPSHQGPMTIDTFGSDFDTVISVYTGNSIDSLTQVATNNDAGGPQSRVDFNAEAGVTYQIAVDGAGGEEGAVQLNHALAPILSGPPNDDFVDRSVLNGEALSVMATTTDATGEPNEPNHAGVSSPLHSLWWEWTPPTTGDLTIDTVGSGFDTTLAVYTGSELTDLSLVASNDDADGLQSQVQFSVDAIETFLIAVDGYSASVGEISLNLLFEPQGGSLPANDHFAGRTLLSGQTATVEGSTEFATGESGEPVHAGVSAPLNSVWHEYVPAQSGTLTIDTFGSLFDTTLAVYTGDSLAGLVEAASNDAAGGSLQSLVEFDVVAGTPYRIAVDGYESFTGDYVLNLSFAPANGGNNNDHFANGAVIVERAATVTGNNQDATGETGEPNHAGGAAPLNSLWWRWTAPEDGVLSLDTYGSEFDTVLAVYTGQSVDALTEAGANDDFISGLSELRIRVTTGETYHIAVDGYEEAAGDIVLNLDLFTIDPAGPPNDDFVAARGINGLFFVEAFAYTIGATGESGEPNHAGTSLPNRSIWYRYTAPGAGRVSLDTLFSDFDTTLAVYTGPNQTNLSLVAENDDSAEFGGLISSLEFEASAGQDYWIAVAGFAGETGLVELFLFNELNAAPPPANDAFQQAFTLTGESGAENGLTTFASGEPGEPDHAGVAEPLNSLWWRWTSPQNGNLQVDTAGSDFDTVLAVYTGSSINDLVEAASNDDSSTDVRSAVDISVEGGETYFIAVDAFGDSFPGYAVVNYAFTGAGALPVITEQPVDASVIVGGSATFRVAATSEAPLEYQWQRRDGGEWTDLPGKTAHALTLTSIPLASDGAEYRCAVSNEAGTAFSDAARLTVARQIDAGIEATHAGAGFTPGETTSISTTISYDAFESLGYRVSIPEGWVFVDDTDSSAFSSPLEGDEGVIEWLWTSAPPSPFNFDYTLRTRSVDGDQSISAEVVAVNGGGESITVDATPNPLVLESATFHASDTNHDYLLSLVEILGTVNLFNHNAGGARTGEYHFVNGVFTPGPGAATGTHSTDQDGDGRIDVAEILRTVGLYNYREDSVRTGEYHADSSGPDGFAPGPRTAPAQKPSKSKPASVATPNREATANDTGIEFSGAPNVTAYSGATGTVFLVFDVEAGLDLSGMAIALQLPAGWTYQGGDIQGVAAAPSIGQTGTLEWLWLQAPSTPYRFTIEVAHASGLSGAQDFEAVLSVSDNDANVMEIPASAIRIVPGGTFADFATEAGQPGAEPAGQTFVPGQSNLEVYFFNLLEANPGEGGRSPYAELQAPEAPGQPSRLLYYFYRNVEAADFTVALEGSQNLIRWEPLDARLRQVESVDVETELWCAEIVIPGAVPQFARLLIRESED